ncbi:MAG: hypothetical protein WD317_07620 [Balneolaceae bacterium]
MKHTHLDLSKEVNKICFKYNVKLPADWRQIFIADSFLPPEKFVNTRADFLKELDMIRNMHDRITYLEAVIEQFNHKKKDFLEQFPFVHAELEALKKAQDTFKKDTNRQVGRPTEFSPEDSKKWFEELKTQISYQHKNGNPHKTKIREEIRNRHKNKTGYKPSSKTIKRHV